MPSGTSLGNELVVIPREDIITDLMVPSNASICRTHLGIPVAVKPGLEELLEKAREAIAEVVAASLAHPRLTGRPTIGLQAIKLDQAGRETGEVIDLAGLQVALREGRRIVLEAPAGRGKATRLSNLRNVVVARMSWPFQSNYQRGSGKRRSLGVYRQYADSVARRPC